MKIPIDIISINCLNPIESLRALDYSTRHIEFNNSYLFTNEDLHTSKHQVIKIKKFNSIHDYSNFLLRIDNFIESSHVLIIQDDGYVLNPEKWRDDFLNYDYIGAPWPNNYSWRKRWKNDQYLNAYKYSKINRVGNGGFSLRSKKFLKFSKQFKSTNQIPEDVFLCLLKYQESQQFDIKFAPFEIAYEFSLEVPLRGFKLKKELKKGSIDINNHFGFHGRRFKNSEYLIDLKNNYNLFDKD